MKLLSVSVEDVGNTKARFTGAGKEMVKGIEKAAGKASGKGIEKTTEKAAAKEKITVKDSIQKVPPKRILLTMQGQIIVLGLSEIIYLRSSSNYTIIKMSDGTRHTSSRHLKTFSETIGSNPDFLRIHRSSIVNKNFVKAILRKGHKMSVLMKDNEELDVSAKKRDLILTELSQ